MLNTLAAMRAKLRLATPSHTARRHTEPPLAAPTALLLAAGEHYLEDVERANALLAANPPC